MLSMSFDLALFLDHTCEALGETFDADSELADSPCFGPRFTMPVAVAVTAIVPSEAPQLIQRAAVVKGVFVNAGKCIGPLESGRERTELAAGESMNTLR